MGRERKVQPGIRRYGNYARASLGRAGAQVSVTDKLADNRRFADERGWTHVEDYVDNDVCASEVRHRPAYERMLADLKSGRIDAIVCWHVDQLAWRPVGLEALLELADRCGAELATVNGDVDLGTPAGRLVARQLGSIARHEQEHKSARQRLRNKADAAMGRPWGSGLRCYGYDETGREIVDQEATVIREVVKRVLSGESMRSAVVDLRARGITTSAGRQWTQQSLSRLLRNPRLAGLRTYHGEVVGKGQWPAVVDEQTHQKLLELLDDPSRKQPYATNVRKYLLSGGFLVCGYPLPNEDGEGTHPCGKSLYTQPSNSGKRGYVCRSGSPSYGCGRIRIAAEPLEEEVTARALARLASPKVRARLEKAVGAAADGDEQVKAALAALDERLVEAGQEYARRDISMVTLKAIEAEVRREQKQLREQLAQAARLQGLPATTPDALAAWWVDAPLERRRDLLALVLDRVVVKPATRAGVIHLDLDRLEFVWK